MAKSPEELKEILSNGQDLFVLQNEDIASYIEGAAKADNVNLTLEQILYVLDRELDFLEEIGLSQPEEF